MVGFSGFLTVSGLEGESLGVEVDALVVVLTTVSWERFGEPVLTAAGEEAGEELGGEEGEKYDLHLNLLNLS